MKYWRGECPLRDETKHGCEGDFRKLTIIQTPVAIDHKIFVSEFISDKIEGFFALQWTILSLESFESKCSFPPTKMQTLVPQSPISTHLSKKNNSCMRSMPTFKLDTTHFLFLNLISVLHKPTKLFSYLSFQMSFGLNHIYQSYLVFISEKYLKFVWIHFVREST